MVMDETPNRTVAHLSAAEHAQRNLLARGDAINGAQLELAHKKRSQAQASREISAREYLREGVSLSLPSPFPPPPFPLPPFLLSPPRLILFFFSSFLFLSAGDTNNIQTVKTFCSKSEREVVEAFKRDQSKGWKATVSVMGMDGERWQEEAVGNSRQEAKNVAYKALLAQLRQALS